VGDSSGYLSRFMLAAQSFYELNERYSMNMKAETLSDVYAVFDPQEPLKGEKLKTYYVDRKSTIKEEVLWKIKSSRKPLKILFPAIRGNGNTTELNKLAEEAKKELFVIFFNTKDRLDMVNVTYVDLLLNIGLQIYESVRYDVEIDPQLDDTLRNWSSVVVENVREEQEALDMEGGVSALIKLTGAMRNQVSTREVVRRTVEPKLSELLDIINRVIAYAEETLGKIFVIIDDLDKIAPNQAENLFFGYSTMLTQLQCNVLYTVPRSLQLSEKIQWVLRFFDSKVLIPNTYLCDKNGTPSKENRELVRAIALNRMEESLIDEEALNYAVTMSGGVMHDFIRIVRESAAKAHGNHRDKIEKEDVESVVFDIRNDYLRFLLEDDLVILKEIKETHGKTLKKENEDRFSDLLYSLVILEYLNNEVWYDVHPAIKGVLE
jgi:hypothetical protein